MFNVGPEKLFVIFAVALIVLGPDKLPEVARQLGRFRRLVNDFRDQLQVEVQSFTDPLLHSGSSTGDGSSGYLAEPATDATASPDEHAPPP